MLGRHEAGKHLDAALPDHVVVIAAAELHAAIFRHAQPPALRAVFGADLLEAHDAVSDALHLKVLLARRHVVEQHRRAVAADKELLERENLAAVAQRVSGEQPKLGKRIDDHARRLQFIDRLEHGLHRRTELHLRRVKHRVLFVGLEGGF